MKNIERDDKGRWLPGNINTHLPRDERGRFISWKTISGDIDNIIKEKEVKE